MDLSGLLGHVCCGSHCWGWITCAVLRSVGLITHTFMAVLVLMETSGSLNATLWPWEAQTAASVHLSGRPSHQLATPSGYLLP